jgi:hypothetical protein
VQSALVFPKLTSNGFNVHLAAPRSQNESCRFQFEQLVGTCIQYASSLLAAIGRDCSIRANHAQICMVTSADLTTHVAIARLWMVRAHFNKRSTQAFSKADHHLNICNTPLAFEYRQSQLVCSRADRLGLTETHHEDAFATDDYGRLLWPWHLPHTRDLVLQGREAHGHGTRSRETRLACDRRVRDRLRPWRSLPTCFRHTVPRRRGLHFKR